MKYFLRKFGFFLLTLWAVVTINASSHDSTPSTGIVAASSRAAEMTVF